MPRLVRLAPPLMAMVAATATSGQTASPLFADKFNRTTGMGTDWHVWYGAFATDGTFAVSGTPPKSGNWASVAHGLGSSDYAISADIIIPAWSLYSGLVARSSDPTFFDDSLYAAQLSTDGSVYLYRRNNWTWTVLTSVAAGIVANQTYSLKLIATGDAPVHLEVWLNGVQRLVYDDSSASRIAQGGCGIENYDPNVKYTNLIVTSVPHKIFSDVFARTTGLGPNWQTTNGTYSTDGTYAISGTPPVSGNWATVLGSLGTPDYAVSANITIPSNSVDSGLVVRSVDTADFTRTLYSAQLWYDGTVKLYRRNDWTWTLLQSKSAGIVANIAYAVKFVASGAAPVHLEVAINGATILQYDDNSPSRISTGAAGIETYYAGVKFSAFAIDAVSSWPAGADVAWTNQVNTSTVGATIRKSGGVNGADDAGGVSRQSIPAGNATFEYTIDDPIPSRAAGLSHSATWQGASAMDYSFRIQAGVAQIYELNVARTSTPVATNDILRIGAINGTVRYYKNGNVIYTSTVAPTYPLYAVASLMDTNALLFKAKYFLRPWGGCGPTALCASFTFVSVSLQGSGFGRVTSSPAGIDCPGSACSATFNAGTPIVLTATASQGSSFIGWGPPCSGTGQCTVVGAQAAQTTVTANFGGGGTPVSGSYPCGINTPCQSSGPTPLLPPGSWVPYSSQTNAFNISAFNLPVYNSSRARTDSDKIRDRLLSGGLVPNAGTGAMRPSPMLFAKSGASGWPTYWATSGDPVFQIDCVSSAACSVHGKQIRAPSFALVQELDPNNGDRHMTIIDQTQTVDPADPTSYLEVDLFHVSTSPLSSAVGTPPVIHAETSGFTSLSGNAQAIPINQTKGQGNAGRVGNLAGRVRIEELVAALPGGTDAAHPYIKHALALTVNCTSGESVYPATTDGNSFGQSCTMAGLADNNFAPPMGVRMRLNLSCAACGPEWNISGLPDIDQPAWSGIPEWKKVFLRTLIKYGAIVMDTGSNFYWSWQVESDLQYPGTSLSSPGPWYNWSSGLVGNPSNDVSLENFIAGGNAKGLWDNNLDGIADWKSAIWQNLVFLDVCASQPNGC